MNNKEVVLKVVSVISGTDKILQNQNINIEEKSGIGNIVTKTDKELENYLKDALMKLYPQAQIISEESAEETKISNDFDYKFIVDPLDGTTNFTNGWPYSVSIGIANKNEMIGGVIYDVLSDTIYYAIKDYGVFSCEANDLSNVKHINKQNYPVETIKKAIISYDTPYGQEAFKTTSEMMINLYHQGASLKTVGPMSLDVLKTALGKEVRPHDYNNAVWHTEVRAWDLAAASVILRELGGEIIGKDGKPLSFETLTSNTEKISFIASGNHKMIDELYKLYKISLENQEITEQKGQTEETTAIKWSETEIENKKSIKK